VNEKNPKWEYCVKCGTYQSTYMLITDDDIYYRCADEDACKGRVRDQAKNNHKELENI
jgi:hypothetical protein